MIRACPRHQRSIDVFFAASANCRTIYAIESRYRLQVLRQEVKPHKLQYSPDNLARILAVMIDVKRVRRLRVIHERNRQIARQRLAKETVEGFVKMRHFVPTCS